MAPKTKSKPTTKQGISDQNAANQALLIRLMGLREEDMFSLVEQEGLHYLAEQCRSDQQGISYLSRQAFYWAWWTMHWNARNAEFIAVNELQNVEKADAQYAYAVDDNGHLVAMTLYGAYRLHHQEAMNHENLCKSYCHIMTATSKLWRKQVFNH